MKLYFPSLLIPLVPLLPNIFLVIFPPRKITKKKEEPLVFVVLERFGQLGIFLIPVFYPLRLNGLALSLMVLAMTFYYLCWARFFIKGREERYLFLPLWKIPVPMAVIPVFYFTFASIVLNSRLAFFAAIIFAVGHLSITHRSYAILK